MLGHYYNTLDYSDRYCWYFPAPNLIEAVLLWMGGPNVHSMPWVKLNVEDDQIDQAIEQVKEQLDCNKSEAAYYLLKQGVGVCREEDVIKVGQ